MTVRELLSRMDSREFSEWLVFESLEAAPPEVREQSAEEIETRLKAVQREMERRMK